MLALLILDCAEHTVLRHLMADGRAPVLADLAAGGAVVDIRSDAHILDGSVFQTLLTGVGPGEHGVYKYVQIVPGTYRYRIAKAAASPVPQVWRVLSDRGRSVCVFDVPKAFPFDGLNGRLVSAWGAYAPAARPGSVPAGLRAELVRRFGRHPQPAQEPIPLSTDRYRAILGRLADGIRTRAAICCELLADSPCDFFATALCELHVASHQFWHLRDPRHPMYDASAAAACGDAIEQLYSAAGEAVGTILEALPSDACVMVLAQQGVESNFSGSHLLPEWLTRREGGTRRPSGSGPVMRAASGLSSAFRARLQALLPKSLDMWWLGRKYPPCGDVFLLPGSEFMAFLRVNLQGREPRGTVPPGQYDAVLAALRGDLLALINPRTGEPAAAEVLLPHSTCTGPLVDALPDAVVRWANAAPIDELLCPSHGTVTGGLRFVDKTHSSHTGEGLAIVAGPGVAAGQVQGPHDLRDINATLYSLLGEPVPAHVTGNPLPLDTS